MLNKKRKGFTLMEIVLVMVLIAILATGVAIGFTSYINRGHETGITTDYNSTFKNPVRMEAIEKGSLVKLGKLKETIIADGFVANTGNDWQKTVTDTTDIATIVNADGNTFGVEKGNKRYQVTFIEEFDVDGNGAGTETTSAIVVRADHSTKNTSTVLFLNSAKNDIVQIVGELSTDGKTLTVDDVIYTIVA